MGGQQPAEPIFLHPALERLRAVLGHHRLSVVPLEAVAQREGVLHPVLRDAVLVDHLGAHLQLLVGAEQRVIHQVGVVARDVGRRPHRVEDLEVGLGHEAERAARFLGRGAGGCEAGGGGRGGPGEETATAEWAHGTPPCEDRGLLWRRSKRIVARSRAANAPGRDEVARRRGDCSTSETYGAVSSRHIDVGTSHCVESGHGLTTA